MNFTKHLSVLLAVLASGTAVGQILVPPVIYSNADSYTAQTPSGTNYGSADTISVKATTTTNYSRGFLKFDLSGIPQGAVIVTAKLRLTPKGTENVTASASTQLYLDLANSTWAEGTITHATGIVNNPNFATITVSNLVSSKREFDVVPHVQGIVDGRVTNFGWRIRRNPENVISGNTSYYSKETGTTGNRPQLVITYYMPMSVSAATVVHATSVVATNGSITPTMINGSSTGKTYRWYNSSGAQIGTASALTGVGNGWYGLKTYGTTAGDTLYTAFIVGAECGEATINFNPGPKYINDAVIYDWISGTTDARQVNNGSSAIISADNWTNSSWYDQKSLLKFNLWMDPALIINEATMTLYGNSHYPLNRPNTSELIQITANWYEFGVSFNNAPATSSAITVPMPNVATGNTNATPDVSAFFNAWKANNLLNYGMLFQLTSYTDIYTRQRYHSSDAASPANSPSVLFRVSLPANCDFSAHTEFRKELDGGYATTYQGKLKFFFREEYQIEIGKKIPLTLYDENNLVVAAISMNGTAVSGAPLLPALPYVFDDNRSSLDLSGYGLTTGKFYVLELTTSIGDKQYIKFQYTN